jgi:hypothetical protein
MGVEGLRTRICPSPANADADRESRIGACIAVVAAGEAEFYNAE